MVQPLITPVASQAAQGRQGEYDLRKSRLICEEGEESSGELGDSS